MNATCRKCGRELAANEPICRECCPKTAEQDRVRFTAWNPHAPAEDTGSSVFTPLSAGRSLRMEANIRGQLAYYYLLIVVGMYMIYLGKEEHMLFSLGIGGFLLNWLCVQKIHKLRHKVQALDNHLLQQNHDAVGPYVLYLRSFKDDRYETVGHDKLDFCNGLSRLGDKTAEEEWVKRFAGDFRVIAVGSPSEVLPPLGCYRYRFLDKDWKAEVRKLMQGAHAVFLCPGITQSVVTEAEMSYEVLQPERLFILCLEGQGDLEARYRTWKSLSSHVFPFPLPDYPRKGEAYRWENLQFGPDWMPMVPSRKKDDATEGIVQRLKTMGAPVVRVSGSL